MTTYHNAHIRGIVLRHLADASKREDPRERYSGIIGTLKALLDDDQEMVDAIQTAFLGPQEKAKELAPPGKAA